MKKKLETNQLLVSVPASKLSTRRINLLRFLCLFLVVAITILIYNIRDHIQELSIYGYPGIFLVALLTNATIFIPAPGLAVVFFMGGILHPLGVAVAAGTGGALGELSGYLTGFSGQAIIERGHVYARIGPWIDKYGGWIILVFAAIPNPFFDLAGIAAGASKMPLGQFFLFCWIGQIIKMSLFAYAGAYSINWIFGILR